MKNHTPNKKPNNTLYDTSDNMSYNQPNISYYNLYNTSGNQSQQNYGAYNPSYDQSQQNYGAYNPSYDQSPQNYGAYYYGLYDQSYNLYNPYNPQYDTSTYSYVEEDADTNGMEASSPPDEKADKLEPSFFFYENEVAGPLVEDKWTWLIYYIQKKNIQNALYAIDKISEEEFKTNVISYKCLISAITGGLEKVYEKILEKIDQENIYTALNVCFQYTENVLPIYEVLIPKLRKEDLGRRDEEKNTILMKILKICGVLEDQICGMVRLLLPLMSKELIESKDTIEYTALTIAQKKGYKDIPKLLQEKLAGKDNAQVLGDVGTITTEGNQQVDDGTWETMYDNVV